MPLQDGAQESVMFRSLQAQEVLSMFSSLPWLFS